METELTDEENDALAREELQQLLKPSFMHDIDIPVETDWEMYFRQLHESGKCYVPEEFMTTILPAYTSAAFRSRIYGFQARAEGDFRAELEKSDFGFEWNADHSMIVDEIRRQGFDPIAHPCHIAWALENPFFRNSVGKHVSADEIFYLLGADGKIHVVGVNNMIEDGSEREDIFFEAKFSRGDESSCQNISIWTNFAPGSMEGLPFSIMGTSSKDPSSSVPTYTFIATREK